MEHMEPTSPIGRRILKRAARVVSGNPEILTLDLAPIGQQIPIDKTSAGDAPELRHQRTANMLRRKLYGNAADRSRLARYGDYAKMYDTVPEAHRILKVIVGMVFGGEPLEGLERQAIDRSPFHVIPGSGASQEVQDLIASTTAKLNLVERVPQMFQSGQLYGDSFDELVYSLTSLVADKPHVARDVSVVTDAFRRVKGYKVRLSTDGVDAGAGQSVFLSPMQMIHYAPSRQLGYRYGEGIFHSLRGNSAKFGTVNDLIHTLAVLQGSQRGKMSYEMPKGWSGRQIKTFMRGLRAWNADVTFMDSDGNFLREVAGMLDYNSKIIPWTKSGSKPEFHNDPAPPFDQLLTILKWDQNRFYLGTGVPKSLAGLLEDARGSQAALREQAMHFVTQVRHWQKDAAMLTLEYLIRAAIAAEVELSPDDIQIRMNSVNDFGDEMRATVQKLRAETSEILGRTGVPMRWLAEHVLRVPPHVLEDFLADVAANPVGDGTAPTAAAAEGVRAQLSKEIAEASRLIEMVRPVVATIEDVASKMAADFGGRLRTP